MVSLLKAKCSSLEKELGEAKRHGAVSTPSSSPSDSISSAATVNSEAATALHLASVGEVQGQALGRGRTEAHTPSVSKRHLGGAVQRTHTRLLTQHVHLSIFHVHDAF